MRDFIFPPLVMGRGALGLALVRCLTGLAFIFHGWPKIQNPMAWMGPAADTPAPLQAIAAVSEFGGGILLIAGLLIPLASLLLAGTMAGAIEFHVRHGHPFVGEGGPSFELAAVYLAIVLMLLLIGPGALSLDALLFGRRPASATPPPAM